MKIAQIIPRISTEASGPSYSVVRLCESLVEFYNDNLILIALDEGKWTDLNFNAKFFPYSSYYPKKLGHSAQMRKWLSGHILQSHLSLMHTHGLWMLPNIYPYMTGSRQKIPIVLSPRGGLSSYAMSSGSKAKKIFWKLLQKPAAKNASCFHATSEKEHDEIRRLGFKQPIAIIPNGVDIPLLDYTKLSRRKKYFLYLGRLHPIKGIEALLRAWALVESPCRDYELLIAGDGDAAYTEKLKKVSQDLELKKVRFIGPVFGIEKYMLYASAIAYILPSYSENFAMTVAEAMSCGTPVIVSKEAPWSELPKKNAGFWVDINPEDISLAINNMIGASDLDRKTMGDNARNWMQNDFNWSDIAIRFYKLYEWLISSNNKADAPEFIRFLKE